MKKIEDKPAKKKTGRPLANISQKDFESLCGLQCTQAEMCCFFDVDDVTLNSWCKRTYKMSFSEIFAIKKSAGNISLRRSQFKLAEKSPAMAIFLGQQLLGQRNYATIQTETAVTIHREDDRQEAQLTTEELRELAKNNPL